MAAPAATSSWFESTRYPPSWANNRAADSPSASPTMAIASPPKSTAGSKLTGTPGSPIGGSPDGTAPTVATPFSSRFVACEIAIAPTRTSKPHGIRGANQAPDEQGEQRYGTHQQGQRVDLVDLSDERPIRRNTSP